MNWSDIGFRIEITGDGSPSLRLLQSLQEQYAEGEAMHHSGGAATETDLIYGTCIRQSFANLPAPAFLVVGLGLGYIEMFIARESLLLQKKAASILSFESVPELRQAFWDWLHDRPLSAEVQQTYDQVCAYVRTGSSLTKEQIQNNLKPYFHARESIQASLEAQTLYPRQYQGILYDAFSSKTTPFLWEEDFLTDFLQRAAAPDCYFATYACKGNLKRALRSQGFELDLQEGFKSKRNRISASRRS